ncbi:UDP-glucuronosyltransferase 3A1-like [Panonychus citri]|uniref:UDP-glucuronosyltransferase 3A1-like n=1 Tax=Panonychus citri TaxID=50023 RepID=UPI0023071374|nr:UDP-glucuronosyltransferase 3A1-like [Panonychus citri]
MTNTSFHFLLTTMNAYGPVNVTLGFGEVLTRHGHKVTFAHLPKYEKAATNRGFGFIAFKKELFPEKNEDSLVETIDKTMEKLRRDPMVRFTNFTQQDKENMNDMSAWLTLHEAHKEFLSRTNIDEFDGIIHDCCDLTGAIFSTGLPVINLHSCNPLGLYNNGPPIQFGLSTSSDRKLWAEMRNHLLDSHEVFITCMNEHLAKIGRPPVFRPTRLSLPLTNIGFYHYPKQLDYTECEPIEPGWHRIDNFIRCSESKCFEIPDNLKDKPGSLIYFSLGSTASNDIQLMQRMIDTLAKSPHRFIISKGFRGDQLKLADNMWGDNYVDQIAVIQSVDLVITHGGNNTLMETLLYGKSLIVVGYYFDQLDNAQRVVDKKIGFRVNPWEFDEDYLLDCIEKSLVDDEMKKRIVQISETMKTSQSSSEAITMIEEVIRKHKSSSTN